MMECYDHCQDLVREWDRDRYLATLYCSDHARPHIFALLAFNVEVARTREMVSDPLPGEVRLQWWSDLISGQQHGDVQANPVAQAILNTIEVQKLPVEPFLRLIDARIFDLYDDPIASDEALQLYCSETVSTLFEMAIRIEAGQTAEEDPEPAPQLLADIGYVYGFTGLLRSFAAHSSRGQTYIPRERLKAHQLAPADLHVGTLSPSISALLADCRSEILSRYRGVLKNLKQLPPSTRRVLLPLSLIGAYLDQMERRKYDPYKTIVDIADWRKLWILWQTMRRA